MNVLLCLSHSIEEYDQLRLLSSLGLGVASIGGYIDPQHPHDDKRPALDIPVVPQIKAAVDNLGTDDNLGAAQAYIPDAVLDWLGDDGVIIYHHYLERLIGQWDRIRDWMKGSPARRVVWRTVGQSVTNNELMMAPLRFEGLEIVRYSPKERNIPGYCGEDAVIRFYKDPAEWGGWDGGGTVDGKPFVVNFTQHLRQRDPYTNWRFWEEATRGLNRVAAGPGSEAIGGTGGLSLDAMKEMLRVARVYLYTGTQPASYTLGLIEAMMTGIPVVSIGPKWMNIFPYGPQLFEGHELVGMWSDEPAVARAHVARLLVESDSAERWSMVQRQKVVDLFGIDTIRPQWAEFLGVRVPVAA